MLKKFVQHPSVSHSRRKCYRLMLVAMVLFTVSQTVGCGVWKQARVGESMMITYRDWVWAKRAYNLRYSKCDRPYANHFESGFRAGYTDVSKGGDGFVPALPPAEYRAYEFQSADGAKCVNSWFEGYPAGVAAAKKDKSGNYNDVMVSRMIDSAISQAAVDAVLPKDVAVVSAPPAVQDTPNRPGLNWAQQVKTGVRSGQLPAVRSTFTPISNTSSPSAMQGGQFVAPRGQFVAPPEAIDGPAPTPQVNPANYYSKPPSRQPIPMATPARSWNSQPPGN